MRRRLVAGTIGVLGSLLLASPAGAQELIDAGGEEGAGGLAFVAMTIMVFVIGLSLFFMDRIRRRITDDE